MNVRHILIQPEATELSEDDEGYEDDVAAKDAEAEQKAQDILDEWKAGDATEDSFAALANEYSDDPGSNTTGGLYEQVYQGQMVTEFNDWCFDPARQTGDTGIIHNESTGYHVMYFVGYDQPYWEVQVSADLVNDAVDTFYEEKTEGYTAEQLLLRHELCGLIPIHNTRRPALKFQSRTFSTCLQQGGPLWNIPFSATRCCGARQAQARLARAHVLLLGLGGVGSYAAECLARSGSRRADPGGQRHRCPHQPEPPAGGPPLHPGPAQGGGGGRPAAGHQSGCRAPSRPRSL